MLRHPDPRQARKLGRLALLAGREENAVVGANPHRLGDRVHPRAAMVLGDWSAPLAALAGRIAQPRKAFAARPLVHLVEKLAALVRGRGGRHRTNHHPLFDQSREQPEARSAKLLAHIADHQRIAQVRLVRPVSQHRLAVRNARKRSLGHRAPVGKFAEQPGKHRLDRRKHIVLRHEAHLEIELVEFPRTPVSPRILVAETGRDLEIFVEPGDHQQLLEHLRRLRKRVELPRMDPARHQVIARALGARRGQNGRLKLGKALLDHPRPNRRDHRRAKHDVAVQSLAAKVEIAIGQPDIFGIFRLARDRQRQFRRRRLDQDLARDDLDIARRKLGVHRPALPGHDFTRDRHHALDTKPVEDLQWLGPGPPDHLGQPIMIAQVDE